MSSINAVIDDVLLRRHRTFSKTYLFTDTDNVPIDLSTHTIKAEIRKEQDYNSELLGAFTVDTSDAVNGRITISMTDTETAAFTESQGYWDMLFELGTDKETWVEGEVEAKGSITNVS